MVVHANGLRKRFGRVDALQGLSFNVPEGSTFALVGGNGAGKTTTIKVLMNILAPTVGTATVLGTDTRALSPKEFARIGYVAEHQDMPGRMTVSAYIDYLRPFYPTWDRGLEDDILGDFRLPPDRRIRDLSHGMRMKMALACALPFRPALLVLDEPLSGLDPLVRDEVLDRLRQQVDTMTILISSHELAEIETVTTHVAFVDSGRLLFQEKLSELATRVRLVRVTLPVPLRAAVQFPAEWLDARIDEHVVSFIDTRFSERDLRAKVAGVMGNVAQIDVEPVALRNIYTSLARAVRDGRVTA